MDEIPEFTGERFLVCTYLAIIESGPSSLGVFFPDVPGCVTSVDSLDMAQLQGLPEEALKLHLDGLYEDGGESALPTASRLLDLNKIKEEYECTIAGVVQVTANIKLNK